MGWGGWPIISEANSSELQHHRQSVDVTISKAVANGFQKSEILTRLRHWPQTVPCGGMPPLPEALRCLEP